MHTVHHSIAHVTTRNEIHRATMTNKLKRTDTPAQIERERCTEINPWSGRNASGVRAVDVAIEFVDDVVC